jgi:alpha-L-fucosidase 2
MRWFVLIFLLQAGSVIAQPADSTAWAQYMQNNRLYWDSLGTDFYDGIIAGNGRLGVNMYRENSKTMRFDIGRSDVTDQRPHYPDSMFTQQLVSHPRLPIGKMVIRTAGDITGANIFLEIWNAEARGTIQTTKGNIDVFFLVPSGEEVVHIELGEKGAEKIICEWTGEKAMSPRLSSGRVKAADYGYMPNPDFVLKDSAGFGICYQPLLTAGEYATAWTHGMANGKHVIDLSVGYSKTANGKATKEAITAIKSFRGKPLVQVIGKHRQWWNSYFKQSFISIPEKKLESYYWLQLYKVASATRTDKPIIDLMGPWFTSKTPWPAIWWNLNTQLTYSPLFASNHLEMTRPLFDLLKQNRQQLINNVPSQWRADAAAIGRMSTFDLVAPLNHNDLRLGQFEPGNLIWTMLYYYRYYQYSGDDQELRQHIYPLLKRSVNYLIHLLKKDEQGIYHLVKSHSPEFADAEDAHYTLAGLLWGLQTLKKINAKLQLKDQDAKRWEEISAKLTPLPVDATGFMIGKDVALTSSHRHYSHLMAVYPYRLLNMDLETDRSLAVRSINHWHSMPSALAGYSYTGASAMFSLLGDGEKSAQYLRSFLKRHAEPGGLYAEAGPCFETPLAFATSLLEMLIQSDDGRIRIFPSVPASWQGATFSKLAAEGAFLVDAAQEKGSVREVKLKSIKGNNCVLEINNRKHFILNSDQRGIVLPEVETKQGWQVLRFSTKPGETITITEQGWIQAAGKAGNTSEPIYYWGLNKNFNK